MASEEPPAARRAQLWSPLGASGWTESGLMQSRELILSQICKYKICGYVGSCVQWTPSLCRTEKKGEELKKKKADMYVQPIPLNYIFSATIQLLVLSLFLLIL